MVKIEYKTVADADKITATTTDSRPTSPHIQIYKWEWTMAYSILHRITAMGCLVLGMLGMLIVILIHIAPEFAYGILWILTSMLGYPIWFLAILSTSYFIFADIKHAIWAEPETLELPKAKLYGDIVLGTTILTTLGIFVWFIL